METQVKVGLLVVVAAAFCGNVGPAVAQVNPGDPNAPGTAIVIPHELIEQAPPQHLGAFLDILVGGTDCAEVRFDHVGSDTVDGDGNRVARLDRFTLQPICNQDGEEITFVTEHGRVLAERLTLHTGERMLLTSLEHEALSPDGETTLVVPQSYVARAPAVRIQYLDIHSEAGPCGRLSLQSLEGQAIDHFGDIEFRLDQSPTPACRVDGTRLSFVTDRGFDLMRHPVVVSGGRTMLAALAPQPPSTSEPPATASPAPLPPSTGTGVTENSQPPFVSKAAVLFAALVATAASISAAASRRRRGT